MAVTVILLPAERCGLMLWFQFILGGESRKLNVTQIRIGFWAASLASEIFFACPISVMSPSLIAWFGAWASQPSRVPHSSWLASAYFGQLISDQCVQECHVWQRVDPPALWRANQSTKDTTYRTMDKTSTEIWSNTCNVAVTLKSLNHEVHKSVLHVEDALKLWQAFSFFLFFSKSSVFYHWWRKEFPFPKITSENEWTGFSYNICFQRLNPHFQNTHWHLGKW